MPDKVLFARQPIFDSRQRVYAYELLFRQGDVAHAEFIDGDLATRSVLLNAYAENSAPQVLNGKPGFLNVSRRMIGAIPNFAQQFLVVEILEHEHGRHSIIEDIRLLSERGFTVALDDFEMVNYHPELIEAVDIIKLDVLMYDRDSLAEAVATLKKHNVKLLAEKVENHNMFNYCQSLGFELFQGYFFCRPEIVRGKTVDTNRAALLELIKEVYRPDVTVQKLNEIIQNDAVLCFKLLKLVNSSFYQRAQQVNSISHAVVMLGIQRIRSWATLVSLGSVSHKTAELQRESLTRAYMCEQLSESLGEQVSQSCFAAGLLSCLDAWFDQPLAELIDMLPLADELRSGILERKGRIGQLLPIVINYMHSHWDNIQQAQLDAVGVDLETVGHAYDYAVNRTDALLVEMTME